MTAAHLTIDLSAARINWSRLTVDQIEALRDEAATHGDAVLASKATRALSRRS